MAAEHYKDKYKECQKFQKQVAKLTEQQGVSKPSLCNYIAIPPAESCVFKIGQPLWFTQVKRSPGSEPAAGPLSASPEASAPGKFILSKTNYNFHVFKMSGDIVWTCFCVLWTANRKPRYFRFCARCHHSGQAEKCKQGARQKWQIQEMQADA